VDISPQLVDDLAAAASRAARVRDIEADLRRDLEVVLVPFARDIVGLPDEVIRAEGTGRSGRFDALLGGVIVEFKRPGFLTSLPERGRAAEQALGYLEDEALQARAVVVTDGSTIGFLRGETAELEVGEQAALPFVAEDRVHIPASNRFAWRPFDGGSARGLLELIAAQRFVGVNVANLIAFLGPGRAETLSFIGALAEVLAGRDPDGRTAVLFEQWVRTAGVPYGIESSGSPWPRGGPKRLLLEPLSGILGGKHYAEALFVLHTYMSVVAKSIAAEVLAIQRGSQPLRPTSWVVMPASELAEQFVALERGDVSDQLGAPGLLATDLFDWYAHELSTGDDLREALRGALKQLGSMAWPEIAMAGRARIDLLRQLYQAVVPAPLRKALGEFFTPRWLAQAVLGRALELYGASIPNPADSPRLLDPSCGSGTFLVAWLDYLITELDARGLGEDPTEISRAVDRVLGIDINPVSAVMARVNLLLALGERARVLPEVGFNVFHADSIVVPRVVAAGTLGYGGDVTTISTAVEDFEVASWLLDAHRMAALRAALEISIRNDLDEHGFLGLLHAEVGPIPSEHDDTVTKTSARLFAKMHDLHEQQRDDVWARVIEQSLAPLLIGRVELVVGNPPWVSWKNLPQAWKTRSESLWRMFGLWQRTGQRSGIPLSDVSTLLLAQSIASYAPGGLVAMLLPQAVLLADPGGTAFRRSRLTPTDEDAGRPGTIDVPFKVLAVEDFVPVKPFSPDAANLTIALFVQPNASPRWPAPMRTWSRSNRQRIRHGEPWDLVRHKIVASEQEIAPVDASDITSPWGLVAGGRSLPLGPRSKNRPYTFGRGFETRGLDGCFTYRILTPDPSRGLIRVVNDPEAGDNTRGESPREGVVEPSLFWPLVKGEDVERWRVSPVARYVLVPYEIEAGKARPVAVAACQQQLPRLYSYLLPWLSRFKERSFYRAELTDRFPWALSGPIEHLTDSGALVFIRYLAAGGRPAAAVSTPAPDRPTGRVTLPYPNNKSNIYYTASAEEAHYIAAFLNADCAQAALGRFAVSTGVTPAALERLPMPKFDAGDAAHEQLAKLGEDAHAAVGDPQRLADLERRIDELVWKLAGEPRALALS
jgi:hypothetical protein